MRPLPPVPPSFTARKQAILAALSTPDSDYTDLSPKGSVDVAIKPLIDRLNTLDGIVTTSSCAGRVSVFLEGRKDRAGPFGRVTDGDRGIARETEQTAVPGGKGNGGGWLYVSHEPVTFSKQRYENEETMTKLLGLIEQKGVSSIDLGATRFARFQFEPFILHVMTASLHYARPILAAAINAGFRESGVQSLKNLDEPNNFPMVAIRTSGLALESVIGYLPGYASGKGPEIEYEEQVQSMVSEEYLELLVKMANERFEANAERITRFEKELFRENSRHTDGWENDQDRRERKRAEGLKQQAALREMKIATEDND